MVGIVVMCVGMTEVGLFSSGFASCSQERKRSSSIVHEA
jgi:hypothetical protein